VAAFWVGELAHWSRLPNGGERFPISFANNVPAIFNGNTSAIKVGIHPGGQRPPRDFHHPVVQQSSRMRLELSAGRWDCRQGSRNNLRGPHYSNFDMGLGKHFPIREARRHGVPHRCV